MMTLFKKKPTEPTINEKQDIDFLKQSIKSEAGEITSESDKELPKLADILKNKPDVKSQLSGIDLEAKTVEERNKGTVPVQEKPVDAAQKPNVQDVRAALAAAIKERSEEGEKTQEDPAGQAAPKPEGTATTAPKPANQAAPTPGVTATGTSPGKVAPKPANQAAPTPGVTATGTSPGQVAPKPANQAAPTPGVTATGTSPGQVAPKPANQAAPTPGVTATGTSPGQAVPAAGMKAPAQPAIAQDSLKEIKIQLGSQKTLIDEQNMTIKNLEASIKKMESGDVNQLATKNQEMLKQLSQKINTIEQSKSEKGEEALSDEEQALVKAGKYLETHMTKVNEVYDKLDTKISDMRKFMTEVDEKERKFVETEDKLNKIQRKAESIIESELLSKSNEAIRNLEETKTKIVEESEKVFEDTKKTIEKYKYEIESLKQKAESSINETGEQLKVTEYEVKKAIDEKIEYDRENMKRVDEVISTMNETVKKILGREDKDD